MDITYSWLKEYVKFDLNPNEVAQILTNIGLEVEHQQDQEEIPGGLAGVVVAKVVECEPHPNSDHLHVTKVDCGSGELLQVVCGAPNVAAGQKVMLATLNTKLTLGGEEVKIKRSKIRGVESFGMLCAEDELGVGSDHSGIMVLPPDAVIGTPAKDYLHLKSETVYTIGLTPNRVDAASLMGVARDFSAYLKLNNLGGELTFPSVEEFKDGIEAGNGSEGAIEVEVAKPELAPRYSGVTIKDITVKESPEWLKKKLLAVGMRPINNIVDITNFILLETGNPLHAFDVEKITGGKIVVNTCPKGTKFKTLDGVERTLNGEELMICNTEVPMCIAGVFGGEESGVKEGENGQKGTTSIFIESAYFNPVSIRKTSKYHGLHTEASFRYERGCDPQMTEYALKRAALLVLELAGGKIVGPKVDIISAPIEKKVVELNYKRIENLIGCNIGKETIRKILEYQDMEFVSENEEGCTVKVPTYRVDVYRECDVVEDVLRIYGYNNVPLPAGMKISVNVTSQPSPERVRKTASDYLAANGFMEIMNNSLTKSAYYDKLTTFKGENCVMIYNPLSSDLNAMRQTLIMGALEVVAYNINRQVTDLKLFEIGNVYSFNPSGAANAENEIAQMLENEGENGEKQIGLKRLSAYKEGQRLIMVASGSAAKHWRGNLASGDYFALKGYVDLLLKKFGIPFKDLEYEGAPRDIFSQGLSYKFKASGKGLFVIGGISKKLLKEFGIKQDVYVAEINWDNLYARVKKNKVGFTELPKYPEVKRDLALLLDYSVPFAELRTAAFNAEKKLLTNIVLFDVYTGDKIPQGKKQYAISFYLQDKDKTLTDNAVDAVMQKLLTVFKDQFGAELR